MKKSQLDHLLRAARRITRSDQFIVIGSQSLHGRYPDLPDELCISVEADLIAKNARERTEWLNAIGAGSRFHESFGYYADPVDEKTAVLPKGWKGRLVNLPPGDTGGAIGLCLDPHDLAISKYAARRDKDIRVTSELARRGLLDKERLLDLLEATPVDDSAKARIRRHIEADYKS
jgi:hypothetical protein